MPPRDMVVFFEDDAERDHRLTWAANLAERWHAHLIGCFVAPDMVQDIHAGHAIGGALASVISDHAAAVGRAADAARTVLDRLVFRREMTHEFRIFDEPLAEGLMLHARHASIAVTGRSAGAGDSRLHLAQELIFSSGLPTILLPSGWQVDRLPRRIVVGWNGSREATRAIADALPLLQEARLVHLVVVPEKRNDGMLGQEPGADMARHLLRYGVNVFVEQVAATEAGAALLNHAGKVEADLLVMGARARSQLSELIFGGATRTVFNRAALPIFLSQ